MAISIDLAIGSVATSGGGGGGSVNTGVLQVSGGGALSGTLQTITDQSSNASPLRLSTTSFRLQNSTGFTGPFLNWRVPDNNSFWLDFRGFNDSGGTYSIFATDRLIIGRNPGLAGFDSATLGLSQTGIFIGGAGNGYASARLHVTGDGTNPIARFEDNAGTPMLRVENSLMRFGSSTPFGSLAYAMTGTTFSGNNNGTGLGFYSQFSIAGGSDRYDFGFGGDAVANTAGTVSHLALVRNFAAGAGSASFRPLNIAYTINNSGAQTGTATGIFLNATETNLNGMTHNFMDLQGGDTGGLSVFRVSKNRVSAVRFETIVRLGGGSDTAQHYIYGGEGNSTGIVLNRANGAVGLFGSTGVLIGDSTFAASGGASARLHVRGDGINPILRLDNGAGAQVASVTNAGLMTANGFQSINYSESFQRVGFNNGANFNALSYIRSSAAGVIILLDNSEANFSRLHFGGTAKPAVCQGSGTPEGSVTAPIGSIFMRSDGGVLSSLYVKQSGTGNTGWTAIA